MPSGSNQTSRIKWVTSSRLPTKLQGTIPRFGRVWYKGSLQFSCSKAEDSPEQLTDLTEPEDSDDVGERPWLTTSGLKTDLHIFLVVAYFMDRCLKFTCNPGVHKPSISVFRLQSSPLTQFHNIQSPWQLSASNNYIIPISTSTKVYMFNNHSLHTIITTCPVPPHNCLHHSCNL